MSLNEQWRQWEKNYSQRPLRERQILGGGICASVFLLMFAVVVDPAEQKNRQLQKTLTQQSDEVVQMEAKREELRSQQRDPDAETRRSLTDLRGRITSVEAELKSFAPMLVSPAAMPQLLRSLLARHPGLDLVSFKTLPVSPLISAPTRPDPGAGVERQVRPVASDEVSGRKPASGGMYRHPIEITLAGSYADLLAYAEELQRISPRPLWSGMQLKVVQYPKSELTFVLYTLSLDLPWLAV